MILKFFSFLLLSKLCFGYLYKNYAEIKFENEPSSLYIQEYLIKNSKSPIILDGPIFGKKDYIKYFTKKFNIQFFPVLFKDFDEIKFGTTLESRDSKLFYIKDMNDYFSEKHEKKIVTFMEKICSNHLHSFVLPVDSCKDSTYMKEFIHSYKKSFLGYYHLIYYEGLRDNEKNYIINEKIKQNEYCDALFFVDWSKFINQFISLNHIERVLSKSHRFINSFTDIKKEIVIQELDKIIQYYIENPYEI